MVTRLVTGGCGFIGSHFIRKSIENGYDVICMDRFSYTGRIDRIGDLLGDEDLEIIFHDLSAPINEWFASKIGNVDEIVHFAGETMVDQSLKFPYPFIISNYFGMFHLLEFARVHGCKKLVIVSTDEVFGPILDGFFKEDDRHKPSNPYSATKSGAETLAYSYFVSYQVPTIIIRTANNYGPYQHAEKVVPTTIRCVTNNEPIPVYGDGQHRRCWIHVEDFCDGIEFVLQNGVPGETYHVAGNEEMTNLDLMTKIANCIGKPWTKKHLNDLDVRPGHDRRYGIDSSKVKQMGWEPKIKFDDGIKSTVEWFLNHQEWLKPGGLSKDR